jgi:hypothetical protein
VFPRRFFPGTFFAPRYWPQSQGVTGLLGPWFVITSSYFVPGSVVASFFVPGAVEVQQS